MNHLYFSAYQNHPTRPLGVWKLLWTVSFIFSAFLTQAQPCSTSIDFSSAIATGPTQAPDTWYTDRYAPAGFVAQSSFGGNDRLKHSIVATDGAASRPLAFNATFYNTQGRKLDLTSGIKFLEVKLYVPSAWSSSNKRMAGLWGTATNASNAPSGYPIIEFTSDGNNPRFRGYESGGAGSWHDLGLPSGFTYDQWVTLKIQLLSSGEFKYTVGDLQYTTTTSAPDASKQLANVILQGHNYDATQPLDETNPGVTYDIYWDDLSAKVSEGVVTNTNTSKTFCSIQSAIDDVTTLDGHTLVVGAGTYTENVLVNKALTINGPNVGIPGTGSRSAEAILSDGTINVTGTGNVVIDGFHIYKTNGVANVVSLAGESPVTIKNSKFERVSTSTGEFTRAIVTSSGSGIKNISNNLFTGSTAGGLFSGHRTWQSGIYLNAASSTVNVTGNTFENVRSAINIDDLSAGIAISGNTFNTNGTDLALGGSSPTGGSYVLGANSFNAPADGLVNLVNVDNTFRLDISSSTFIGATFNTSSLTGLFGIESRIYHRGRDGRKGLVTFVPGNQYVIATLTTIQSAIDYSTANDIIHVSSGTYNETLTVNKNLIFEGANKDVCGTASRGAETILIAPASTPSLISLGTSVSATFNGFKIDGMAVASLNDPGQSLTIKNSVFELDFVNSQNNLYSNGGAVTLDCNYFKAIGGTNDLGNSSHIFIGSGSLTATNNKFTSETAVSALTGATTSLPVWINLTANTSSFSVQSNVFTKIDIGILLASNAGGGLIQNNEFSDAKRNNSANGYGAGIAIFDNYTPASAVTIQNNKFYNSETGIRTSVDGSGPYNFPVTSLLTISNNSFETISDGSFRIGSQFNSSVNPLSATCNWFSNAAVVTGNPANITYVPKLTSGTDNSLAIGFQTTASCVSPIQNLTHPKYFATIQAAINDPNTQPGDVIKIDAGTYNENFTVSKNLTFEGANKDVCGTATRGAETILIAPATPTGVISLGAGISATFNGFKIDGLGVAYLNDPTQSLTIKNSVFELDFIPAQNNLYSNASAVTLDCNYFKAIGGTNDGSSSHIFIGNGTFTATNNKFTSETAVSALTGATTSLPVWINLTANASNLSVQNNEFTKIDIGILLAGNAGNGTIQNNEFSEAKRATYTGGSSYGTGIAIFGNYTPSGPVSIQNNKFYSSETGIRTSSGDASNNFPAPNLLTISNNSFETISNGSFRIGNSYNSSVNSLSATCNWFSNAAVVTGNPANITYLPKLVSGTDDAPNTIGFQTSAACLLPVHNVTKNTYFATIQAAISDAGTTNGDEIVASDGTYNERVTVSKEVKLTGASKAGTIIDGTGLAGTGSGIFINDGITNVTIKNFTIQNFTGSSGNSHAGIYANAGNNNLTITDVIIKNNPSASGIYANGPVSDVLIDKVDALNNGPAARRDCDLEWPEEKHYHYQLERSEQHLLRY